MTTELVRVTTELELSDSLYCRLPNKRALIAALHKIGVAIGALPGEVAQVIQFLEKRQRDHNDKWSKWSYRGEIACQASLGEWRLPVYRQEEREQLPLWAQALHFCVYREDGEVVLRDLRYEQASHLGLPSKHVSYSELAMAVGIDSESPAMGCQVHMTLPRAHEEWVSFHGENVLLPLSPFMKVLEWFFSQPGVRMHEDERKKYAQERNMALSEAAMEPHHSEVAPDIARIELLKSLGEYLKRRFTAGFNGESIEFTEFTKTEPLEGCRHPLLWGDSFRTELELVHPTMPDVVVHTAPAPDIYLDDVGDCNGEIWLDISPSSGYTYWESPDEIYDLAVLRLTFDFSARPPHTLVQKRELQCAADEFAAKLRECFEPVMQTLQGPPPAGY